MRDLPTPDTVDTASLRALPYFVQPDPAEIAHAAAIVDSHLVVSAYASCEWSELHEDGQVWIAAIVREATRTATESTSTLRAENEALREALHEIARRGALCIHQNIGRWDMRVEHDRRSHDVLDSNNRIALAALSEQKS